MNDEGNLIEGEGSGNLVIQNSWPSQIRTVYGDHQRMIDTYFSEYEDIYFTEMVQREIRWLLLDNRKGG